MVGNCRQISMSFIRRAFIRRLAKWPLFIFRQIKTIFALQILTMDFTITPTDENISYWQQKEYLSETTKHLMVGAEVLIAPEEGFRDYPIPVFPRNTLEIFDFLKEGINVEVAIDDEQFQEVALNSRVHKIGKYIVNAAVLPVFFGLITNYIYDKLKHEDPKDQVELEIVVDKDGKGSSIKFKGTTDELKKVKQDILDLRDGNAKEHREDSSNTNRAVH